MAKIIAPEPFSGLRAGVAFADGVGDTCDAWLISWFKGRGYRVILDAAEEGLGVPEPEDGAENAELSAMTVRQIREYAAERGIDTGKARSKADIIAAIERAESKDG